MYNFSDKLAQEASEKKGIKSIIAKERENMPEYQYNFLYKRVMPGFVFVIGGAIVVFIACLLIEHFTKNEIVAFIPFIAWAVTVAVLLVLFVTGTLRLNRRIDADNLKRLNERFYITDSAEAEEKMRCEGITKDSWSINGLTVPLSECDVIFFFYDNYGSINFSMLFANDNFNLLYALDLDAYSYTWFVNNIEIVRNKEVFGMLVKDKEKFITLYRRYKNPEKMLENF